MIKLNSLTNLESFNDKPGTISDSETDEMSQDFTAILISFAPVQPANKLVNPKNVESQADQAVVPESLGSELTSSNFETFAKNAIVENQGEVSIPVRSGANQTNDSVIDFTDSSHLENYETLDPILDNTRQVIIPNTISNDILEIKPFEQIDFVENNKVTEQLSGEFKSEINESWMPPLIVPEIGDVKDSKLDPKGSGQFEIEKSANLHGGLPFDQNIETRGQRPLGPRKIETKDVDPTTTIELEPRGQRPLGPSKIEASGSVNAEVIVGEEKRIPGVRFLIDNDNILDIQAAKSETSIVSANDKISILNFDSLMSEDVEIVEVRNPLEAVSKVDADSFDVAKDKSVESLAPFETGVSKSSNSKYADRSAYQSLFNDRANFVNPDGYASTLLDRLGEKSGIQDTGLVKFPTFGSDSRRSDSRIGENTSTNSSVIAEFSNHEDKGEHFEQANSNKVSDVGKEISSELNTKIPTSRLEVIQAIKTGVSYSDFESTLEMKTSNHPEIIDPKNTSSTSDLFSGFESIEVLGSEEPKIEIKPMTEFKASEKTAEVESDLENNIIQPAKELETRSEIKIQEPANDIRTQTEFNATLVPEISDEKPPSRSVLPLKVLVPEADFRATSDQKTVERKPEIADRSTEPNLDTKTEIKLPAELKGFEAKREFATVMPEVVFQAKPEITINGQIKDFRINSEVSTNDYPRIDEISTNIKSSEPVKYYESDASLETVPENSETVLDAKLDTGRSASYFESDLNSVKPLIDRQPIKNGESISGIDQIKLNKELKQTIGAESAQFELSLAESGITEPNSAPFEKAKLAETQKTSLSDSNHPDFKQMEPLKDKLSKLDNFVYNDFSEPRAEDQPARPDTRSVVINREIAVVADDEGKLSMPLFVADKKVSEPADQQPLAPIKPADPQPIAQNKPLQPNAEQYFDRVSSIVENKFPNKIQQETNKVIPDASVLAPAQTQSIPTVQVTNTLTRLYSKIARIFRDDRATISKPTNTGPTIAPEGSTFELRDNRAGSNRSLDNAESQKNITESLWEGNDDSKKLDGKVLQDVASSQVNNFSSFPSPDFSNTLPQNRFPANPAISNEIRVDSVEKPDRKSGLMGQAPLELSGVNFEKFIKSATTQNESVSFDSLIKDQVVVKQIEPKIIEMAEFIKSNEEKQLIKLRLKPAELGEVEIQIERDAGGNIRAQFHTTNETTRHILSESLGQLRDSLQNSGVRVESLEVTSNPQPSTGNEKGDQQSRHDERFERGGSDASFSKIENEDESQEDPAQRLVNLRA